MVVLRAAKRAVLMAANWAAPSGGSQAAGWAEYSASSMAVMWGAHWAGHWAALTAGCSVSQ